MTTGLRKSWDEKQAPSKARVSRCLPILQLSWVKLKQLPELFFRGYTSNSQLIEDALPASETEQSAPCAGNRTPRRRSSPGNTSSQYFVQLTSGKRSGAWVLLSSSLRFSTQGVYIKINSQMRHSKTPYWQMSNYLVIPHSQCFSSEMKLEDEALLEKNTL